MGEKYAREIYAILDKIEDPLLAINPVDFSSKPQPHKWSKKEILGHLIDSAYNNHQRFLSAEKKENLFFDGYDQDEWVVKNGYQKRDKSEVISLFFAVHRHIALLISNLTDEELIRTSVNHNFDKICMRQVELGKSVSLGYLVEDYIFHLKHHLGQVVG